MALIYNPEGLYIESSGNTNKGQKLLNVSKLCNTFNAWNPLLRFTVSGNTQNVHFSIYARYGNDRSTLGNNNQSYHKYSWVGATCSSAGVMTQVYTQWIGEYGVGGGSFDWSVSGNYIQLQTYLWSEPALVNMPVHVVCSDWSKVTVTYY